MRLIVSRPDYPEWSTLASGQTDIEDSLDTCGHVEAYDERKQNALTAGVCGVTAVKVYVYAELDNFNEQTGGLMLAPRCKAHRIDPARFAIDGHVKLDVPR